MNSLEAFISRGAVGVLPRMWVVPLVLVFNDGCFGCDKERLVGRSIASLSQPVKYNSCKFPP